MEFSMDVIKEAALWLAGQFELEELGLQFVAKMCNMISSQIIPVINDNPEEPVRLLCFTDKNFVDGLVTLMSKVNKWASHDN